MTFHSKGSWDFDCHSTVCFWKKLPRCLLLSNSRGTSRPLTSQRLNRLWLFRIQPNVDRGGEPSSVTYVRQRGGRVHAMAELKIEPNAKKMLWSAIPVNPAAHTKESWSGVYVPPLTFSFHSAACSGWGLAFTAFGTLVGCARPTLLSALDFVYPIGGAGRLGIGIHGLWNLVDRRRSPRDRRRLPVMAGFFVIGQKGSYDAQRLDFYFQRRYFKLFQPQNFVNVSHTLLPFIIQSAIASASRWARPGSG